MATWKKIWKIASPADPLGRIAHPINRMERKARFKWLCGLFFPWSVNLTVWNPPRKMHTLRNGYRGSWPVMGPPLHGVCSGALSLALDSYEKGCHFPFKLFYCHVGPPNQFRLGPPIALSQPWKSKHWALLKKRFVTSSLKEDFILNCFSESADLTYL